MNRLVVVDDRPGPVWIDRLQRAWDAGDAVFPLDHRLPPAEARRLVAAMRPDDPIEPGDALVVATSGSTGEPKGVVLTHDAVAASADATSRRLGVDHETDRWLACLPLSHVGGLSVLTRALHTDTPVEVHASFDASAVEASARAGVTLVSLVATALARIDASLFRLVVLGGSPPPPSVPTNVVVTYGMTETGSGVVYDGVPLDGVDVRVAADGEILVRGPMVFRSYRDGTDPKDDDGWFATGDTGEWVDAGDDSRRLVVHGRRGDLVITGGEKVWPAAVEAVLADHPRVAEVAVVGRPDPEWGQRVVAVVVPRPGPPPTLDELRDWVKGRMAPWCAPRELNVRVELPRARGGLGKVIRSRLL